MRGAAERLAPILMTSATTAFALLPIVVSPRQPGHEIEAPKAVVILGGLFASMVASLYVVPLLYRCIGGAVEEARGEGDES
jgi:Cu/Ag efflux pump CusA